jgi:hypothetical protein
MLMIRCHWLNKTLLVLLFTQKNEYLEAAMIELKLKEEKKNSKKMDKPSLLARAVRPLL